MKENQETMLDDLLEKESGLTSWELEFIDNLDQNWREKELTNKQAETLLKIWERRT